jgi:hypothetical protein
MPSEILNEASKYSKACKEVNITASNKVKTKA